MKGGDRAKGQICGVDNCRTQKFYEGEDGFLYCINGHRKGDLVIGSDDDDFEGAARRDRTTKKKDSDGKTKVYKHLKGAKAVELYLKSLQLILRHQVWFLIHDKGLPAELEVVVQDLWTVRILQFEDRIADEKPVFHSSQAFPDSETDADDERDASNFEPREKKLRETPTLIDCLVLCYLGITTLRLPFVPGDIYTWTTEGKMVYRKALQLIPASMRDRLPSTYLGSLEPDSLLPMHRFYKSLVDVQRRFEIEHGFLWPPLNVPVLLLRFLRELALPLELYDATVRLGSLLEFDFAVHSQGKKRIGIRHMPEAQLISCLVVCVKLFYPFDGEQRYPKSNAEPAATSINWPEWSSAMRNAENNREENEHYTTEELTKLKEKDVFAMSGTQLDQYLDFYLENFIDEHTAPNEFQKELYELFPVVRNHDGVSDFPKQDQNHGQDDFEAVRMVHSNIKPVPAIKSGDGDADVKRPGQGYLSYKKKSLLPEHAKVFYEEAAKMVGLTMDMLVAAVFSTESRIDRWKRRQREGKNV